MTILSGTHVSEVLRKEISSEAKKLQSKLGRSPGLAVILVGDNPASHVYVKNKIKACGEVGFHSVLKELPATSSEDDLLKVIEDLNEAEKIDGILVQLPLPKGINEESVTDQISPFKDADGLTAASVGLLFSGRKAVKPCTPAGVIEILKHYKIPMSGKNAVVIGRSHIVGRPMAELLLQENATVSICHSKTADLRAYTSQADIVVVAAGQPRFIGKDHFKKGAVVVDVGMHRQDGKLCGDVRFEELDGWASAATPVPGGVGPMTITMLLQNTLYLAKANLENVSN